MKPFALLYSLINTLTRFVFFTAFVYSLVLLIPFSKSHGEISSVKRKYEAKYIGHCGTDYISVHYDDPVDYQMACEEIQKTETFFKTHLNYSSREPVQIVFGDGDLFIDETIRRYLEHVIGLYVPKKNTIIIKPWEAVKQIRYMDHIPISKNYYSSVIVHELAHHFHYVNIKNLKWDYDILNTEFIPALVQLEARLNKTQLSQHPLVEKITEPFQLKTIIEQLKQIRTTEVEPQTVLTQLESIMENLMQNHKTSEKIIFLIIKLRKIMKNAKLEYKKLETEFLASVIAMEIMANPEKTQFLNFFNKETFLFDKTNIDSLIYEIKPSLFLISAYTVYQTEPEIIQHIFNGKRIGSENKYSPFSHK